MVPDFRWFRLGFFDLTVSESDTRSVETTLQILNFDLSWASDMRRGGRLSDAGWWGRPGFPSAARGQG